MKLLAIVGLILTLSNGAAAQSEPPAQPQKPAEPPVITEKPEAKSTPPDRESQPHRFWDRKNVLLFSGAAASRAFDYASTRDMRDRGRDEILLTNEVVDNKPAFIAIEAAGAATNVLLSYWAHRKGHHKIERWLSIVHISVTTFGAVRNYNLKSAPGFPP